jgi:formylglycine-generating enzyme required for sulfatase activity
MTNGKMFYIRCTTGILFVVCFLLISCDGDNATKVEEFEEFNVSFTSPLCTQSDFLWPQILTWETDYTGNKELRFDIEIRKESVTLEVFGRTNELFYGFDHTYNSLDVYSITLSGYQKVNDEFIFCDEEIMEFTAGVDPSNQLDMLNVQGVSFEMGDYFNEGEDNELPAHQVNLSSFSIAPTEITQIEYSSVVGGNPSFFVNPNLSVGDISWFDAITYCNLKSEACGFHPCYDLETGECNDWSNGYRLPYEAEWEYAARGGEYWADSLRYSGCNEIDSLFQYAWYYNSSGLFPHTVAMRQPNQLEIYDMSGNVMEWCNDWYDDDYYALSPIGNPEGPENGTEKVCKGGCYNYSDYQCRVAFRGHFEPTMDIYWMGFRVVRSVLN